MKSHRGLSSVIGAVFLIAIVMSALSYITYSLEIMGNFSESLITEESRLRDRQSEAFQITSIDIAAGKLDVVIKNTGQIPVKITTLYIDEIGVNDVVNKTTIDKTISPGSSFGFLSESIDIDIDPTKGYNLKLITSRGETQTFYLNSASQEPLDIRLVASPDRIPTGFSTTLMMVVVNNMSNNNPLVNLTPIDPVCSGICTKLSGPTPVTYDTLNAGDVAIFRWSYALDGDENDSTTFTSGIENGFPGNTDSETVTIKTVEISDIAGKSLVSLGFGQTILGDNIFVLHTETYGIPATADYQMTPSIPDTSGTPFTFDDTSPSLQWFSANATVGETTIVAGNWNASLRYNSARLPSGMDSGADNLWDATGVGGITYHFNDISPSSGLYDSGTDSTCTALASSNGAGVFGDLATNYDVIGGVNGSGAYVFDGDGDYIKIDNGGKNTCTGIDRTFASTTLWFKGDERAVKTVTQTIFANMDLVQNDVGGIIVEIGDGTTNNHGQVFFTIKDDNLASVTCKSDRPDGDSGPNYLDGEWHHVAASYYAKGKCKLWIDGIEKDDRTKGGMIDHLHNYQEPLYVGSKLGVSDFFKGTIDDLLYWNDYVLTADDVTALFGHSFGENSTRLNVYLSNATGVGVTDEILASDDAYGFPWVDQGSYTDVDDLWAGGNWTSSVSEVILGVDSPYSRLNFTLSYASGAPLNLRIDDENINGAASTLISSYLQTPPVNPSLPVYHMHDNDNKVTFFAFNGGDEGVWFTYQGTRVIFNGTNGHYTGIVDTVSDGVNTVTLSADTDSPFIDTDVQANIVFWHPQNIPKATQPGDPLKIPPGTYDVNIYLNGYDEDGTIFIRSINLGDVKVVD